MNKVVLIGRLVKDTTLSFIPGSGTAIQKFTIAVDKRKKEDGADFLNCVWFGKGAEATANYMSKGKQVAVSGRIQTGNYVNKEGNKVYTTDILVEDLQFLGGKNENTGNVQGEKSFDYGNGQDSVDVGDMPF
jgi:single-strand DNA-binding protein